jgi:hypothetical protein
MDDPIGFNEPGTQQQDKRKYQEGLLESGQPDIFPRPAGDYLPAIRVPERKLE